MIILTRKIGQSIVINDEVVITVLNRRGKTTTLGVDAPKHCKIDREEVHKRRQLEGSEKKPETDFTDSETLPSDTSPSDTLPS